MLFDIPWCCNCLNPSDLPYTQAEAVHQQAGGGGRQPPLLRRVHVRPRGGARGRGSGLGGAGRMGARGHLPSVTITTTADTRYGTGGLSVEWQSGGRLVAARRRQRPAAALLHAPGHVSQPRSMVRLPPLIELADASRCMLFVSALLARYSLTSLTPADLRPDLIARAPTSPV